MLSIIKQKYVEPFRDMPANIKLVVILTVSVFLPVYITVSAIVASFLYIVCNKSRLKSLIEVQHINLLIILAVSMLVIPLYYKNYYGFLCGILFIMFIVLEIYISKFMSSEIFNLACDICCGMSLICIFASIIQKVFENQQRVEGLTYNPNFYAYIIELVVVICFYKIATSKKSYIYIFIAAANMLALCFTGCRSGWGALLAGLFILFLLLKKRKYIGVLLALLVAGVIILYYNPSLLPRYYDLKPTINNRLYIWQKAFSDFLSHPLFGRGFLAFYQVTGNVVTPHAHNILLDTLECTGIFGTAIIIFFFVIIIRQLITSYKSNIPEFKASAILCCSIIIATLVHGLTDMPIMGINTGLFFFLLLAFRPKSTCGFGSENQKRIINYAYIVRIFKVLKKGNLTQ